MPSVHTFIITIPKFILNSLLYIINAMILLPSYTLCIVYRIIAVILIKLQYEDATMFNSTDTVLALGKGADGNQLMYATLCSGEVDIDLFRSRLKRMVINHPKLRSYVKEKYGYYFWLKQKEFNINDHVTYRSDLCVTTKEEWEKIENMLYYHTPLHKDSSPWWIQFVPYKKDNEESPSSFYIVAMFYHCIGDGYSILYSFLESIADNEEPRLLLPSTGRPSLLQYILIILQGLFLVPLFLPECIFFKPEFLTRTKKCENQNLSSLGIFKTEEVANIKRATRVPFFVVLLTCMMGALENFFLKSKHPMPREVTVSVPQVLWKPEDEVKLTNNFILVNFKFPFSRKSGKERLEEIYNIVKSLETRNRYMVHYLVMRMLAGITPSFFGRWVFYRYNNSVMFSIAAMEHLPRSVLGQRKMEEKNIQRMLTLVGNVRILFQALTIGDEITLSIHENSAVISKDELEGLVKDFEAELETLKAATS